MKNKHKTITDLLKALDINFDLIPLINLNSRLLKEQGFNNDEFGNYFYQMKVPHSIFEDIRIAYKIDLESIIIECSKEFVENLYYNQLCSKIQEYFEKTFDNFKESYTEFFTKNKLVCSLRRNNKQITFTIKYPLIDG